MDFFTDGRVQFWNNSGAIKQPGTYPPTFNFDTANPVISGFTLSDAAQVSAGTITPQVLGAHSIRISFSDVSTAVAFDSFSSQIGTAVAAVPEPASLALLSAGLGLIASGARRAGRRAA